MAGYYIYKLVLLICRTFSRKQLYKIADAAGYITYLLASRGPRSCRKNLRTILGPGQPKSRINRLAIETYKNFSRFIGDFFSFPVMEPDYIEKNICLKNGNALREEYNKGKGVIIVSAHMANWEIGGHVFSTMGFPIYAVALAHEEPRVNDLFIQMRKQMGVNVIDLNDSKGLLYEKLRQGNILAIIGERIYTSEFGVEVCLCGKPVMIPTGAYRLSIRTGAPIVPVLGYKDEQELFHIEINDPIHPSGRKGRKEIKRMADEWVQVFENNLKAHPEQWFTFFSFWDVQAPPES